MNLLHIILVGQTKEFIWAIPKNSRSKYVTCLTHIIPLKKGEQPPFDFI